MSLLTIEKGTVLAYKLLFSNRFHIIAIYINVFILFYTVARVRLIVRLDNPEGKEESGGMLCFIVDF